MPRLALNSTVRSCESGRRYRIRKRLGQGGFGVAYRATPVGDAGSGDVCIKIIADQPSWHRECYLGEMLLDFTRAIQVLDSFPLVRGRRGGTDPMSS